MPRQRSLTPKMISDFCRVRLGDQLDPDQLGRIADYLTGLLELLAFPPYRGKWIDWGQVAAASGVEADLLLAHRHRLQPLFDALSRTVAIQDRDVCVPAPREPRPSTPKPKATAKQTASEPARRGPRPKTIVELPEPISPDWVDVEDFETALVMHMRRHGDSVRHLYLSLASRGSGPRTLMKWCTGQLLPRTPRSFAVLNSIERRYRLPVDYFRAKLPHKVRAARGVTLPSLPTAERRRMAWHLPDDFLLAQRQSRTRF